MTTSPALARTGAVAAILGAASLLVSTLLHPMDSDPNDAQAAFAEYAASTHWVWIHLGQFIGLGTLGMALVALAGTIEPGRATVWSRFTAAGATALVAVGAALQAVDGVALKAMVDRWAAAAPEARAATYEAAFAVRQIEIGLASLSSLLAALTLLICGVALCLSERYPNWLGGMGVLTGVGLAAAGAIQAQTGFSDVAMTVGMLASSLLLLWFVLSGALMWRLAVRSALLGDAT